MNKLFKVLGITVIVLLTIIGLIALLYRSAFGLQTTGMGNVVIWGLWVAFYIFFIGLSAGSFLLSTLVYVFGLKQFEKIGPMALFSAIIMLIGGLLFVGIDLGHMERGLTVFVNRNPTSVLCWEIHFYVIYIIIVVGEIWLLLRHKLANIAVKSTGIKKLFYRSLALWSEPLPGNTSNPIDKKGLKILGWMGIPTAIGVHGGTGMLFAVVIARPYWYSPLLPIVFLVSALASGGALLTFIYTFMAPKDKDYKPMVQNLARLTVCLLLVDLLLISSELIVGLYGAVPDDMSSFNILLTSSRAWIFWGWQIGLGCCIPLFLMLCPKTNKYPKVLGIAGLMIVTGIIGVRWNIVIPGYVPEFKNIVTAFVDPRLSSVYIPSIVEVLSSVGIFGTVILIFLAGCKLLPIFDAQGENNHE